MMIVKAYEILGLATQQIVKKYVGIKIPVKLALTHWLKFWIENDFNH